MLIPGPVSLLAPSCPLKVLAVTLTPGSPIRLRLTLLLSHTHTRRRTLLSSVWSCLFVLSLLTNELGGSKRNKCCDTSASAFSFLFHSVILSQLLIPYRPVGHLFFSLFLLFCVYKYLFSIMNLSKWMLWGKSNFFRRKVKRPNTETGKWLWRVPTGDLCYPLRWRLVSEACTYRKTWYSCVKSILVWPQFCNGSQALEVSAWIRGSEIYSVQVYMWR